MAPLTYANWGGWRPRDPREDEARLPSGNPLLDLFVRRTPLKPVEDAVKAGYNALPEVSKEWSLPEDPNYKYGDVLPFAKNKQTGEVSLAVPKMLRRFPTPWGAVSGLAPIAGGIYEATKSAVTAPMDAWSGKLPMTETIDTPDGPMEIDNPEVFKRAWDIALTAPLGVAGVSTVMPTVAKGDLGVFVGRKGAWNEARAGNQRPMAALDYAQALDAKGLPREDIWRLTGDALDGTPYAGAFKGADGQWRLELDDSSAVAQQPFVKRHRNDPPPDQLELFTFKQPRGMTRGTHLKHPDLYAAYPDMRGGKVGRLRSDSSGGEYRPLRDETFLNHTLVDSTDNSLRDIMLHEWQHGVQQREGFASAGGDFVGLVNSKQDAFPFLSPERQQQLTTARNAVDQELANADSFVSNVIGNNVDMSMFPKDMPPSDRTEMVKRRFANMKLYNRDAGEVEARNVENRSHMNMDQRRALPPWKTTDIPEDQISVFDYPRKSMLWSNSDQLAPFSLALSNAKNPVVRAYHGTDADITKFKPSADSTYAPDRALGTHFAVDPAVSSKFADGLYRGAQDPYLNSGAGTFPGGRVYPVDIDTTGFRTVDQPAYDWRDPTLHKPHEGFTTDQTAIARMMNIEGFKQRPDILERYLVEARKIPEADAKVFAQKMVNGETVDIDGGTNLEGFVNNYGGTPYNNPDRAALIDAARTSFQNQGVRGFKYTNTSPREMEGAVDPTTYVPLAPGTVKSATTGETLFANNKNQSWLSLVGGGQRHPIEDIIDRMKARDAQAGITNTDLFYQRMAQRELDMKRAGIPTMNDFLTWGNAMGLSDARVEQLVKSLGPEEVPTMNEGKFKYMISQGRQRGMYNPDILYSNNKNRMLPLSLSANVDDPLWHDQLSTVKLAKPVDQMTSEVQPVEMADRISMSPEDLFGSWILPVVGDRSRVGRITKIGPYGVDVNAMGGPNFMRTHTGERAGWASAKGPMTTLQRAANKLGQEGKPVFGSYTAMGLPSVDFSHHMIDALMDQVPQAKLSRAKIKEFDEFMKKPMMESDAGGSKQVTFDDWVGLGSKKAREQLMTWSGGKRKYFAKKMEKSRFRDQGFPDVAETRLAVVEPDLVNVARGDSGYNITELTPGATLIPELSNPHPTYPFGIQGRYKGSLDTMLPYDVMFRSGYKKRRAEGKAVARDTKSIESSPLGWAQYADQEWLDNVMKHLEATKNR